MVSHPPGRPHSLAAATEGRPGAHVPPVPAHPQGPRPGRRASSGSHVESEGMQRVKEATETAAAKKEKDAGAPQPRIPS